MRITNTHYTPIDLLAELMTSRRTKGTETKNFFSGERASHDWLITAIAEKIDVVLESFKRYDSEVVETQFVRDHGVDIRMTYEDIDGDPRRIGFQIKSNNEADRDAIRPRTTESMISTLKRQAFEAERHGVVAEWWVISCFNSVKHKNLVSAINTELGSGSPGRMRIKHVTPREAMGFLTLDDEEIDSICTLLLCSEDPVLRAARTEILALTPIAQEIVWGLLGNALEGERQVSLSDIESFTNADSLDELQEAIDSLGEFITYDYDGESFLVEPSSYPGLCALYFDARVRHEYSPKSANKFVWLMTRM